ncbi:MAG: hypothetical protein PWP65_1851 [Clostridia bacterium]|nr:hypothetical protein [Clostridia bacterium]
MKIAIATEGNRVSQHFGHCPEYTIFTVNDGSIVSKTIIPNPGHQPGFLPGYLSNLGVSCIIAGGMGPRAQELFAAQGIKTVLGVSGEIEAVMQAYLSGKLQGGESTCDHGHHYHDNCGQGCG